MKGAATQDSIYDLNSLENSKKGIEKFCWKSLLQGKIISFRWIWLVDVPDSMLNLKNEK